MDQVVFLGHSGFCLELEECSLIFDYWNGRIPYLNPEKPLYVFASHGHPDHYNKEIFKLRKDFKHVRYILADDIRADASDDIMFVESKLRKTYELDHLKIETVYSTDEGVAYYVKTKERTVFHFGDLNWWHWEDESPSFNQRQKERYQQEIAYIKDFDLDIVLGPPLDERLTESYWWAMEYFLKNIKDVSVFPMHFFKSPHQCQKLVEESPLAAYQDRIHIITYNGQRFTV